MSRHYIEIAPDQSPRVRSLDLRRQPLPVEHLRSERHLARQIAAACFISGFAAGLLLALAL